MKRFDRRHFNDLPINQFNAIVFAENSGIDQPRIFLTSKQAPPDSDRHVASQGGSTLLPERSNPRFSCRQGPSCGPLDKLIIPFKKRVDLSLMIIVIGKRRVNLGRSEPRAVLYLFEWNPQSINERDNMGNRNPRTRYAWSTSAAEQILTNGVKPGVWGAGTTRGNDVPISEGGQ